jgi:hypothetical protein
MSTPTNIEKENLEAHVELCAQRYDALEQRLSGVENSLGILKDIVEKSHMSMTKILIGTAGTVVTGIVSLVVVILLKS